MDENAITEIRKLKVLLGEMKGIIILAVIMVCAAALVWRLLDSWTAVPAGNFAYKVNRITGECYFLQGAKTYECRPTP